MKRIGLIVVGAGPAGLSAAIEAAKRGVDVVVFDENARPGGQLFKQIHKFFGSKEHRAKVRGFRIGKQLLEEADAAGVQVVLDATVIGVYLDKEVVVRIGDGIEHYKADAIIIATGAAENMVPFPGWTLPGVIGAGAAQTMMNLHGVRPGQKVLMLGSGNVGLVVSFQLKQAGCDVVALADAAPRIGGYGVHASKLARTGIPFYLPYTIKEAEGTDHVTGVTIAKLDERFQFIPGTEIHFDVDTICIAVGLSPMSQLASNATCDMALMPKKGGNVAILNEYGETSIPGIYCAGDVAGIEEASSAMIQGRRVADHVALSLGYLTHDEFEQKYDNATAALNQLRQGMFSPANKGRTDLTVTDEGYPLSMSLLKKGYMTEAELKAFPAAQNSAPGIHPVIECTQNIPCNPCQDACKFDCIKVGADIVKLPEINTESKCTGCGMCVASCSGQAIFLINEDYEPGYATVSLPYEILPLPKKGDKGKALGRDGSPVCDAEIVSVRSAPAMDKTQILTMKIPLEYVHAARFYKA